MNLDPNLYGIVHNGGQQNGPLVHLPLEEVRVHARVVDISAHVTLIQVYSNPDTRPTSQAVYCFPVPEKSAVCAFELSRSDGTVIQGICKPKAEAREEYDAAVARGQTAGLVQWVTDDIFRISVGSIPASETVEAKVTFVMNLMNEDNVDHMRLQLPMHIGVRYGGVMEGMEDASVPTSKTRVRFRADIQTGGLINSVQSPSHPNELVASRLPTHVPGRDSRRRWTVSYKSKTFLEKDFVLIIHADQLDAPRCFAELEANPESGRRATLALQLTIIPNFNLPPVVGQEYIFLLDTSGSMNLDNRISTAKDTVNMLLRLLPIDDTTFNVFAFSNHCHSLWSTSVAYHQDALDRAGGYVDSLIPDNGTELLPAMSKVLKSRNGTRPTAIFVMTDGEVEGTISDDTSRMVRHEVDRAPENAPLRVYTLGIGEGVSHATCQGIAEAGKGVCLFATTAESMVGKCARLLRAGRTPVLKDITLDWGVPPQQLTAAASSVAFTASADTDPGFRLRSSPIVQQVPTTIDNIHAGMRFAVFAIIKLRGMYTPKEVVLRGSVDGVIDGGRHTVAIHVPIRAVQLKGASSGQPQIHTLAAWYLIQEHRRGWAPLPLAVDRGVTEEQIRRAYITRLGVRYQIATEQTSFVAVGLDELDNSDDDRRRSDRSASPTLVDPESVTRPERTDSGGISWSTSLRNSIASLAASIVPVKRPRPMPGAWVDSPSGSRSPSPASVFSGRGGSIYTHSTMSSLVSYSSWSDWSEEPRRPRRPRLSHEDREMQRAPEPAMVPLSQAPADVRQRINQDQPLVRPPLTHVDSPPVDRAVLQVIRLQHADGSFKIDDVRAIIDAVGIAELQSYKLSLDQVATVAAVAFISKRMAGQKELLDDILYKANAYLGVDKNDRVVRIIGRASKIVQ